MYVYMCGDDCQAWCYLPMAMLFSLLLYFLSFFTGDDSDTDVPDFPDSAVSFDGGGSLLLLEGGSASPLVDVFLRPALSLLFIFSCICTEL